MQQAAWVATIAWLVFLTCFQAKTTERNEILFEEKSVNCSASTHLSVTIYLKSSKKFLRKKRNDDIKIEKKCKKNEMPHC